MRKRYRRRAAIVVLGAITACMSLTLSTTQQTVTAVMPTTVSFGMVAVGSGSSYGPITVNPAGSNDDDYISKITFDSSCPDFRLMNGTGMGFLYTGSDGALYGSGNDPHVFWMCMVNMFVGSSGTTCSPVTYTFGASFNPSSAIYQTCIARIYTYSGAGNDSSQTVTFEGSGFANQYAMSVNPMSYYFGTVSTMGMSTVQNVTVTNTGTSALNLSYSASDTTHFMISASFTNPIPPSGSATFGVTCYHPANGMNSTTLGFNTLEGAMGSSTLSCDGVSSNVTVDTIDFGTVDVNSMPADVLVTFHNSGTVGANLSNFAISSSLTGELTFNPSPPASLLIGPGQQSSPFSIRYRPMTTSTTGTLGQLTFFDGTNTLSAPIKGNAVTASIGTNPASVDFGPVCAGTGSARDVIVQTNAAAAVTVSALSKTGPQFNATTTDALPKTLGGNGVGMMTVHTSVAPPSSAAAGEIDGSFTLQTDIPAMSARDIPMKATVILSGLTPTPASVSFSAVQVGNMSEGKSIVLANCGSDDVIMDARLSGASPGDFVIESPPNFATLNKMLGNGESQTFLVQMTPRADGDKSAVLLVDHSNGTTPIEIPLDGTGYGGSGSGTDATGKNRETYYACSTGRPFGLAPVGLAVWLLARRRRRK